MSASNQAIAHLVLDQPKTVTKELVCELAELLASHGVEPTINRIRFLNANSGSASYIQPHLKAWKAERKTGNVLSQSVLSEDLIVAAEPFLRRVIHLVSAKQQEELERHDEEEALLIDQLAEKDQKRAELQEKINDTLHELEEAKRIIERQEAQLEHAQSENELLTKANERVQQEVSELKASLAQALQLCDKQEVLLEHKDQLLALSERSKEELKQDVNTARAAVEKYQTENAVLQDALSDTKVSLAKQTTRVETADSALSMALDENMRYKALELELTAKWNKALSEVEHLRENADKLTEDYASIRAELQEEKAEHKATRQLIQNIG